jgi:integrase
MAKAQISARLLQRDEAQPRAQAFDTWDANLQGFLLRVNPSGHRSYYAQVARGHRVLLGKAGVLTPDEARERCKLVLGNHAHGRPLLEGIAGADEKGGPTLGAFISDTWAPWWKARRPRTADYAVDRMRRNFEKWYSKPLTSISTALIQEWAMQRLAAGKNATTVDRDVAALSGVLTRAVKLGHIEKNPARAVERGSVDRTPKVRFLDAAEERRLRDALAARDAKMIEARRSANRWRAERKHEALPVPKHYGDHLTPAVIVSMNTGLRRGELLALEWSAVELTGKHPRLTVAGTASKSGQTRHVPLNAEAVEALKRWREESECERVFRVDSLKKSWAAVLTRAKITAFRWHDLRHHFASRLVQAGAPLNTVRDLLGHADLKMCLRYAHLAPGNLEQAVALLVQLTTRV